MERNVSSSSVTINQLQIDGKTFTKAKIATLPVISFYHALEQLMEEQIEFVARFPIPVFSQISTAQAKQLNHRRFHPSEEIIRKFCKTGYDLTGVILYQHTTNTLSTTWFVANEVITNTMETQEKLCTLYESIIETISNLDDFDLYSIARAMRTLTSHITNWEVIRYCEVCEKVDLPGDLNSHLWGDEVAISFAESQQWFDEGEIVSENTAKDEIFGSRFIRRGKYVLPMGNVLDEQWLHSHLERYHPHKSWASTRKWLLHEINRDLEIALQENELLQTQYQAVMKNYQGTPIITL